MCRQRSTDPLPNWGGQFTVAGISVACGFDCLPKHNDPSRSRLNSCIWATPTRSLAWPRFDESLCYGGQSKPSAICWQRLSIDPTIQLGKGGQLTVACLHIAGGYDRLQNTVILQAQSPCNRHDDEPWTFDVPTVNVKVSRDAFSSNFEAPRPNALVPALFCFQGHEWHGEYHTSTS